MFYQKIHSCSLYLMPGGSLIYPNSQTYMQFLGIAVHQKSIVGSHDESSCASTCFWESKLVNVCGLSFARDEDKFLFPGLGRFHNERSTVSLLLQYFFQHQVIIDISSLSLLSFSKLIMLLKYFTNSMRTSSGSSSRLECISFSLFSGEALKLHTKN